MEVRLNEFKSADDTDDAGTIHSRRDFLRRATAATLVAAAIGGSSADMTARSDVAGAVANSPTGGPVAKVHADGTIVQLDPKPWVTPMFTSTQVQLGPEAVLGGVRRADDLRLQIGLASVQPGMKYAPHMHDGRSILIMLPGLKADPGSRRTQPPEIHFDGKRPTREFNNGGVAPAEGARAIVMLTNGYSVIPSFKNQDDPFVRAENSALPDKGQGWHSRPIPPKWQNPPPQTHNLLDGTRDARKARGFTMYPAQFGPLAWGADIDYCDPAPYLALIDFEPNGVLPPTGTTAGLQSA